MDMMQKNVIAHVAEALKTSRPADLTSAAGTQWMADANAVVDGIRGILPNLDRNELLTLAGVPAIQPAKL